MTPSATSTPEHYTATPETNTTLLHRQALERWLEHAPLRSQLEGHLGQVLPLLDLHLYGAQGQAADDESRLEKEGAHGAVRMIGAYRS
jgi:hypothetical protein